MKIPCFVNLSLALFLSSASGKNAADDLRYIPATLENTSLADGTALEVVAGKPSGPADITRGPADAEPDNHWHWRENAGSGTGDKRGLFAAAGQPGNDAPMLRTTVTGLTPKTDYQVFGCFWSGGFTSDAATPEGENLWDIRLGCGIAAMMGYGLSNNSGFPGTIGCGENVPWKGALHDSDGDKRLLCAPLGTVRTDAKGSLVVYVDDQAEDANAGRTWYDGIGVLPAAGKAGFGCGAPGALHRAVRCGDWEMVRRELEAGAELNALDRDGLTPLFYACVDPDLERIAGFLKAGAAPDVEGQTRSPLWVAATAGRADLAGLLLKSGAKVPLEPPRPNPQRATFKLGARSHPAAAAVCSGSLQVLKLLLDREPELDLDGLFASAWAPPAPGKLNTNPYAVLDAVTHNHPEMAEYLIDLGCQIQGAEFRNLPEYAEWKQRSDNTHGSRSLLIAAVLARPPMRGVVAALARRGVKLVDDNFAESESVVPWDALSAAALAGDADLTARLLSTADGVGHAYKTNLIVLARTSGNREVIALVENRFGDVRIPRWDGRTTNRQTERVTDEARVFELRKKPFKPRSQAKGSKVLAVISDPDAAGPAAAITAKASAGAGWICVEREQIETLLQESGLAKPWDDQVQDLSSLGDRLSADLLIIVSRLKSERLKLLRIEAIDVRSGLPIDRLHLDEEEFKPDSFCGNYLADIRRKFEDHLAGDVRTAITLLPITVDPSLGGVASLEGLLHAGLLQKIDQTAGMIALTREQMQPLAEEKTLKQTGKLWGAAWTIEGGLRPLDGNRVELALRVRSLGKDALTHDVKAAGNLEDLQALVKDAWAQIPAVMKGDPTTAKPPASDTPEQLAASEAARLLREAEWLHNIHRDHDAAPLIDAALYLGAEPLKTNLLRMNIHGSMRTYWVWGRNTQSSAGPTQSTPEMPQSPSIADEAAHHLGEFLELLRINAESLNRLEKILADPANNATEKGPLNDFMWNLDTLIFYRSVLQPGLMTPANTGLLKEFDAELARHLKRVFALITPSPHGLGTLQDADQYSYLHFKAVPALPDAMAEAIVRLWDCSGDAANGYLTIFKNFIGKLNYQGGEGLVPDRAGIMCDSLEKALTNSNSPFKKLRLAEIKFLRSCGEQRTVAARELLRTRISMSSGPKQPFSDWVPVYDLANWSPMPTSDIYFNIRNDLPHGDSLIPSLLYSSVPTPDQILRQNHYAPVAFCLHSVKHQDAFAWPYTGAKIAENYERRLNRLVSTSGAAGEFDSLLSSARLMDQLLGVDLAQGLEPKVLRLRPKGERKYFGSRGQFPILGFEGTVDGKLLTDVRTGVTDKPAMITHTMVDPKNRHILWLVLQPYEDWDFKLDGVVAPDNSVPPFVAASPWLLAIDCRDGHTIHKIKLAAVSGLESQTDSTTSRSLTFGDLINHGMFANDTHLLIQLSWYTPRMKFATLLINRETGAAENIREPLLFRELQMPGSTSCYFPVAGVANSFFIVQETEAGGTMMWQIRPGKAPRMVAKSGRRPEESPFDAEDRKIRYIINDGGRLLAASSWGRFGHFDPQSGTWTTDPDRTEAEGNAYLSPISRSAFHATLFPQHLFAHEDGSVEAFAGPTQTEPGRLKFQNGGGPLYYLPVNMKTPDSYRARFQVISPPPPGDQGNQPDKPKEDYEWISAADVVRSSMVSPAIMNQTDAHFVLATHFNSLSCTRTSGSCLPYLPFLWIIDKPAMLAGMKKAQQE